MPYRHGHVFILILIGLAGIAFWPTYLSDLPSQSFERHVHGITAMTWMVLLVVQSWSIHHGQRQFHRVLGKFSLALFPFMTAGFGLLDLSMARTLAAQTSEFHNQYAARFGSMDVIAFAGIAGFFYIALRDRRDVKRHAGYMFATVVFLIGGILQRAVPQLLDPLTGGSVELSVPDLVRIGLILTLLALGAVRVCSTASAAPVRDAVVLVALQWLAWETIGASAWWGDVFTAFGTSHPGLIACLAFLAGAGLATAGWRMGRKA